MALATPSCDRDGDDDDSDNLEDGGLRRDAGGECDVDASHGNQPDAGGQVDGGQQCEGDCVTDAVARNAIALIDQGRTIFRYDTFGSEHFFGDQLRLHEAIEGEAMGGVGPGLDPQTALSLGLKVDVDALPEDIQTQIAAGAVDLTDPATTVTLLEANAVVGVTAFPNAAEGGLESIGIQCSFCHSTVDDAFAPGIGHRLDGWPNQDLNVGAIVAFAPDLSAFTDLLGVDDATVRTVLASWGPGKYDAELILDGRAFQPDGRSSATVIPPAFGLLGQSLHTWTGFGSVPYWNAYVAVTQMHGTGNFFDPRLDDADRFPVAARSGLGHTQVDEEQDLVTSKLPALHFYQLVLPVPEPPAGSFDADAAARGDELFSGRARCAECHVPPLYTEPGWPMHTGAEIGIDDFQASRSPEGRYRTAPLRALFTHARRGFYHDGRFATLDEVVQHYDETFGLGLDSQEQADIVQYLLSL